VITPIGAPQGLRFQVMNFLDFALWLSGYLLLYSQYSSFMHTRAHMSAQPMTNYSRQCPGASEIQIFSSTYTCGKSSGSSAAIDGKV